MAPAPEKFILQTTNPADMTEAEAATELANLAAEIARHDALYHGEDNPELTDADYDRLVARNRQLEAAYPALIRSRQPNDACWHPIDWHDQRWPFWQGQTCPGHVIAKQRLS